MDIQQELWDNFCRYHAIGDWHGTWTRYSPDREVIESFQAIRSFRVSEDRSEINHQNHYTYADGKTEVKTFGPYKKPLTALFLDNSFSSGSKKVESGSKFGFETGFSYEDRRATAVVIYDENGTVERITTIPEQLASLADAFDCPCPSEDERGNWQGTLKTITSDLQVSPAVVTAWKPLDLGKDNDYLTLHFPDGISVSVPRNIENGKEFSLAVNWQVNPALMQRGIRHFGTSGFSKFTLEKFTAHKNI